MMRTLLLGSLATSAMASNTTMSIVSKNNSKFCLDLLGERTQDGTPIQVWDCKPGLLGQQWFFDAGSWKIRSAIDGKKCIDVAGGPSHFLVLMDCADNSTTQFFGWDAKTNAIYMTPSKGQFVGKSLCITAFDLAGSKRTALAPCSPAKLGQLQQWNPVVGPPPGPTKNATFTFSPGNDTKSCLDLETNKTDNGSPVKLAACTGSKSQQWIFAQGSYRIANMLNPNKCVDALDMKKGNKLVMWDCNGFPQQQWGYQQTKWNSTGIIYLAKAPDSHACLDRVQSDATVGDCIQWQLKRVKPDIIVV